MPRYPTPFELLQPSVLMGQLLVEAQIVITLRLMGMAGVLPTARGEAHRMVAEKASALHEAGLAVARATRAGKGAHAVAAAGLSPLRRRTKANVRRLTRAPKGRGV